MEFLHPYFALLFLMFPLFFIISKRIKTKKNEKIFIIPVLSNLATSNSRKKIYVYISQALQFLSISILILILMFPVLHKNKENIVYEGIDIAIAIDVSNSMLAMDYKPNRLEVAKKTAIDFIEKRKYDKISIILFAGESITLNPLTVNHTMLLRNIKNIHANMLNDGTAIGLGIATAAARLKNSSSKSKILILLTDGANNAGEISPEEATKAAINYGIKIYPIAIGKRGKAKIQLSKYDIQEIESEIDEKLLMYIATRTGGKFFHSTNTTNLKHIYKEIDKLEKNPQKVDIISEEIYISKYLLIILVVFLSIEIILRSTVLRML